MPVEAWSNLTTLDINAAHNPDVIHDLEHLPLPFEDNSFDELHAYEVLEHTGTQGDWKFFFDQWADFWRVLKPSGYFFGTCPSYQSMWAWGDPSHKRVITAGSFLFLSQAQYQQVGKTAMSDFRFYYKADFDIMHCIDNGESLEFVLRAKK